MHFPDTFLAYGNLFCRCSAINGRLANTGSNLLFQTPDTLHLELIKIVTDDCQKLNAFQQGCIRVVGHAQHAAVECQPGEFTVQV